MIAVETDCEDQGFSRISDGCFKCLPTFMNGRPVRQPLEKVERGGTVWWECPKCHSSYGEAV